MKTNIADEIRLWEKNGEWYVSPGTPYCDKGDFVRLGNGVSLGRDAKKAEQAA